MPYTFADKCALYYETRGEAGTPLLLIAGYGATLAGWPQALVERLAAHHRVILFDNRGAGNSGKPNEPYTMAQLADDAAAVLDAAGADSAHVLGVSMGGMIAQNLALRHADRVRGLVLGCTIPAGPRSSHVIPPEADALETLLAPRSGDTAEDIRRMWPILYSAHYLEERRDHLERMLAEKAAYPPSPQYALECQMHAVAETHDVLDRLCEIQQPALVLTGSADVLIPPENSRLIAEGIPDARLIEYAGAGHDFLDEAGDRVVEDILRFLAEVDAVHAEGHS